MTMNRKAKREKLTTRNDDFAPIRLPANPSEIQRRDLTTRAYQLRIDTINEKERTVDAVIATEARVLVFDWNDWTIKEEILVMTGCRIPADRQVPMLDTHDRSTVQKQFGSTRNLRIEDNKLIGQNTFSSSEETKHAWTLTREKHLRDNSIGYKVHNSVIIPAGEKAEVAGQTYQASANYDLRISTDWEPKENSLCVVGADSAAKNRNENTVTNRKDSAMEKFKEWLTARGLDFDRLSEITRNALQKDFEDEQQRAADTEKNKKPAPAPAAEAGGGERAAGAPAAVDAKKIAEDAAKAAVQGERQRIADINALGGDDVKRETIASCITDGKTIEEARAIVLKEIRESRPAVKSVQAGIAGGSNVATREVLEDALVLRAGYEDVILKDKTNGQRRAETAHKLRDLSLLDICRHALVIEGREVPMGREDTIRAAFSTLSLPIILGNVANKSLLRGYTLFPETWRKWCGIGQVSDFKTVTRARLTDTGALEKVGSGGEVKYGGAEEEYEQYNIATYAKNWAITRVQIINDDLQVITKLPMTMGIAAQTLIGDLVYAHLMINGPMKDGLALFVSGHSNLNTGKALSAENLKTALTAFGKQKNKAGKTINAPVKYLLVPPDLQWLAKELLKSSTIVITGAGDSERGSLNVLGDLNIEAVNESRLSNSTFTGNSTSTWYLSGDPNMIDTIEVAFLNGRQEPTLERFSAGPDRQGIVLQVYQDTGCKSLDHRGLQKNTT